MFLIGCALLCFIPTQNAHAATFDVCFPVEFNAALSIASSNGEDDVINFTCSTTFSSQININILDGRSITIDANRNSVNFDTSFSDTLFFNISSGSSLNLNGLNFMNGGNNLGGAIFNDGGTVTISNSTFTNNIGLNGGAIANGSGTMTISNSTFTDNGSILGANGNGGAVYNNLGTLIITNSTFINNSATRGGAVANASGTATISNSTFTNNTASIGGAIFNNDSTITITNSTFTDNSASLGEAIFNSSTATASSQDSHYQDNTCSGTITDNDGNTVTNATGCPGNAPVALSVSALSCNGDNAEFTINAGDGDFTVTGTSGNFPPSAVPAGLVILTGPATWTDIIVTERGVNGESIPLGGIDCSTGVIIPPVIPPAPSLAPAVTVLGCVFDAPTGVEIANAPDNTYCRIQRTR